MYYFDIIVQEYEFITSLLFNKILCLVVCVRFCGVLDYFELWKYYYVLSKYYHMCLFLYSIFVIVELDAFIKKTVGRHYLYYSRI